ncbi:MAG: ComF family protein [Lachnospiraceae bacterium]
MRWMVKHWGKKAVQCLLDLIYPRRCPVCDEITDGEVLHPTCATRLVRVTQPTCLSCGKPVGKEEREYCEDCNKYPKHFIRGYALYVYNDCSRPMMMRLKYQNRREYAHYLGQELARTYAREWMKLSIDVIIPVPIHAKKLAKRGYNQAELLAREIAKILHIPIASDALVRKSNTKPQKELTPIQRWNNLQSAFAVSPAKMQQWKAVLLVDDIYTTGATMEACTRILQEAGVQKIYVVSVCIGNGL